MSSTTTLIQPLKIYELIGEQSNKSSTARTRNSGLKQFNMFLQTKNVTIKKFGRSLEHLLSRMLLLHSHLIGMTICFTQVQ